MADADQSEAAAPTLPADERRRARQAQIEAEQAHGEQLLARYGRDVRRERFASVGYAPAKRRRR
jgi:hypothetical protein